MFAEKRIRSHKDNRKSKQDVSGQLEHQPEARELQPLNGKHVCAIKLREVRNSKKPELCFREFQTDRLTFSVRLKGFTAGMCYSCSLRTTVWQRKYLSFSQKFVSFFKWISVGFQRLLKHLWRSCGGRFSNELSPKKVSLQIKLADTANTAKVSDLKVRQKVWCCK